MVIKRPKKIEKPPFKIRRAKKKIVGWREWVRLPDFKVDKIKAKLDTGARTSALHAFRVTPFTKDGASYVRFFLHPLQRKSRPEVKCVAVVIDHRTVTDSGGRREERPVIRTTLKIGKSRYPIELTLTNRDDMGFRMLLGRQALRRRYLVDPGRSFVIRKKKKPRRRKAR
ncbi:MAG: ATP-dependent zinc protease [Rhodospirillaceae bacterium]|nr:ATP-dependent zinc protease [Rhodospirillaceae bacterium]